MKRYLLIILMAFGCTSFLTAQNIFSENFNNNTNGWSTSKSEDIYFDVRNGQYIFEHKREKGGWNSSKSVVIDETKDFEISTKIYKVNGIQDWGYGLLWGRADVDNAYEFNLSGNGQYQIGKWQNGEWVNLKKWEKSSAIRQGNGAYNSLVIRKNGNYLSFYINEVKVHTMTYPPFFGQRIGFGMYRQQRIAIDYLRVSYISNNVVLKRGDNDVFLDNFSNNNNDWSTAQNENTHFEVIGGKYIFEHKREKGGWNSHKYVNIDETRDFDIQTLIKKVNGVQDWGYGLLWGRADVDNAYEFNISGNGQYQIGKWQNGEWVNLKKWGKSSAIRQGNGASNKLQISKKGNYLNYYINGIKVYTMAYQPFFGQRIGFGAYRRQRVEIDYLKVTYLDAEEEDVVYVDNKNKESILYDDFNDNTNGWPMQSHEKAGFDMYGGKWYFEHKQTQNSWIVSKGITIDETKDFEIETRIQKISGVQNYGYGMVWGRKDSQNQYEFELSGSGSFEVGVWKNGEWNEIKKWTNSSVIKKGNYSYNTLKIVKKDNNMSFYINGTYVFQTAFRSFLGDKIGYLMYNNQKMAVDYLSVSYLKEEQEKYNYPPEITITEPAITRGFNIVKSSDLRVAGKVRDTDGISTVKVNGKNASVQSNGDFSVNIPVGSGSQDITVIATDRKGKSASETFTVQLQSYKEKRLALIIGNASYTNGGSLKNPVNDAIAMERTLTELGFTVMKHENCDQGTMKRAIDDFGRRLEEYDVGLFFYAGHGVQVNGMNYLVPTNANLLKSEDVEYDCVRADRVMAKMESANAKTNIIVLDACRDNPFERSWNRSTKGKGLAFMNAPAGSLIAYATSPGNTASDGFGSNGLYTESLLKHIKTPNISIEDVFKRVRMSVIEQSSGQQTPWESTSLTGDFYFKK